MENRNPGDRLERVSRFRDDVTRWFAVSGRDFPWRRPGTGLFELVVTECLLQRTRAEVVADMFDRFFEVFPGWQALDSTPLAELQVHLKPIGLWRRRATGLKELAREMVARKGRFPGSREELEELPAIGQYVASAVLDFAFEGREPLLDSNMARVLERYFGPRALADIRYDPYLQELAREVVSTGSCVEVNWAILDFAALVCKPRKPACDSCPLSGDCRYRAETMSADGKDAGSSSRRS